MLSEPSYVAFADDALDRLVRSQATLPVKLEALREWSSANLVTPEQKLACGERLAKLLGTPRCMGLVRNPTLHGLEWLLFLDLVLCLL